MKILVTSLPDLKRLNQQRPHHLLKNLSKKHEISVLCVKDHDSEEIDCNYLQKSLKKIDINYISEKKLHPVIQEIIISKKLSELPKDFDLHINFNSLIGGYQVTKKTKLPTLFDICDDLIDWINISPKIPSLLKPIGIKTGSFLLKQNIKMSDEITCSLNHLQNLYKIPENKCSLIPNGVDTDLFQYKNSKIREIFNIPPDRFLLVFVGYLGNWVDLETVFSVIKILKKELKLCLLVVGNGDKFNKLKSLSKKLKIEDSIIFTGDVPYDQVPKYISAADICLVPFNTGNVSQGAMPIKILEYMACSKPVLSTPITGVINTVGNNVLYYENAINLKKKLIKLVNNKDFCLELGLSCNKLIGEEYNWLKISKDFERILMKTTRMR